MVKTTVQIAWVDVLRQQRQAGYSQAIGNAHNGQCEKNQHDLLPDRWKIKVPEDETNDEDGYG
jgi:hypothetical protein